MLPPFTVGIRAEAIGDYDIGSGAFDVPEDLALDCIRALHADDVDVAMSYRMQADHGFAQLLVLLGGRIDTWPVLPIHVNCAGPPLPSIRQVQRLGTAVAAGPPDPGSASWTWDPAGSPPVRPIPILQNGRA